MASYTQHSFYKALERFVSDEERAQLLKEAGVKPKNSNLRNQLSLRLFQLSGGADEYISRTPEGQAWLATQREHDLQARDRAAQKTLDYANQCEARDRRAAHQYHLRHPPRPRIGVSEEMR